MTFGEPSALSVVHDPHFTHIYEEADEGTLSRTLYIEKSYFDSLPAADVLGSVLSDIRKIMSTAFFLSVSDDIRLVLLVVVAVGIMYVCRHSRA